MDTVPVEFMLSLVNLRRPENTFYTVQVGSLVYDSRNMLAAKALMNEYDRVLWIDSDMVFEADTLERLSEDMDKEGLDFVSALCFKRKNPTAPCVYSDIRYGPDGDGVIQADAETMKDYPEDSLFECAGAGFGLVLVSTKLLGTVWEKHGPPFDPMPQMGEDLAFCYRARQEGYKLYCDSRVKTGHVGKRIYSEEDYKKQKAELEKQKDDDENQNRG